MTANGRRDLASDERSVSLLAELAREVAEAPCDRELDHAGRARLSFSVRRGLQRPSRRLALPLGLAAALVAVVAVAGYELWPRPIDYEVRGARLDGPYLSVPSSAPISVDFSDGSVVRAEPGSRLRVEDRRSDGARVLIERGRALVSVAHRKGSSWSFSGGPFEIHVTGTRFEVSWDPASEVLDLGMLEGVVEVHGPLGGAVTVRAGQRFRAELATRSMTVVDTMDGSVALGSKATPKALATPADATPEAVGAANAPGATPLAARSAVPAHEPWPKLIASGEFELIVRLANERGLEACFASCSASDLRALAEASRYTKRREVAERALLGLRQRFAGSSDSRSAAFLLGRLAEAAGSAARAETWYGTYLSEAPSGELAAEALAGRMRTIQATQGTAAAGAVAREYLSRYPEGVHAKTARRILGTE